MAMRTLIVVLLLMLLIVSQLGMSLYHLLRDLSKNKKTVFWLTLRIACSVLLFMLLCVGAFLGWWQPHPL